MAVEIKKPWEDEKLEAFKLLCECYKLAFASQYVKVSHDPDVEFERDVLRTMKKK